MKITGALALAQSLPKLPNLKAGLGMDQRFCGGHEYKKITGQWTFIPP